MYVLDTNALSELRRLDRANAGLADWAQSVPTPDIYLSVITILEIELGVAQISRRDPTQGVILREWIDTQVLTRFAGRILPVDVAIATRAARLHVPDPRPERDALIAATALVNGMTIVTRNVSDFGPMGVAMINPWTANG